MSCIGCGASSAVVPGYIEETPPPSTSSRRGLEGLFKKAADSYSEGTVLLSYESSLITYDIKNLGKKEPLRAERFERTTQQDLGYLEWSFEKESQLFRSRAREGFNRNCIKVAGQIGGNRVVFLDGIVTASRCGNVGKIDATARVSFMDSDAEAVKTDDQFCLNKGRVLIAKAARGMVLERAFVKKATVEKGNAEVIRSTVGELIFHKTASVISSNIEKISSFTEEEGEVSLKLEGARVLSEVSLFGGDTCVISLSKKTSISGGIQVAVSEEARIKVESGSSIKGNVVFLSKLPGIILLSDKAVFQGEVVNGSVHYVTTKGRK